jgi:hypothetical protein
MIDTDKYEGQIEFDDILREIVRGVDISEGNYDILRYYRDEYKDLLAEVKKLREELSKVEEERDKYDGALNIALEHLGYQGADHDGFCKDKYECNVYGDDLEEEE